ncbi:MAG TPA: hypothetical protein VF324_03155 [Methanobacterium sp.]
MIVNNLDKIIGLVGLIMGIEIIAIAIFISSILYIRNPVVAGLIANISSFTMTLALLSYAINRERNNLV